MINVDFEKLTPKDLTNFINNSGHNIDPNLIKEILKCDLSDPNYAAIITIAYNDNGGYFSRESRENNLEGDLYFWYTKKGVLELEFN